ncbi:pantoate--beta-alanine ligase [Solitalea koreensis]|uniref:Pantothenate synthetase n=1 Tax=Solitalea koreensis TaxID=543615 RepID=A0A521CFX4_9SPHI|nr:pantoate--beta-alanine ligase [Solitalea koreensis]SMO58326.1 pantoate--beta-alanine ligase [Solitalea koreensis]
MLQVIHTKNELIAALARFKAEGKVIGLVPTMGALHDGHISLIQYSKQQCDITVASIFVNPTQFNDPADLERYPRPIERDTVKLQEAGCDILFLPSVSEMYAENEQWHIDLGRVEHVLEGAFRPGHYQGVTQIVKKLFDVVKPDFAFFGQKDYQQFLVISKMVEIFKMPLKLVCCPTIREKDGLAMSSRNIHLSETERNASLMLSKLLFAAKNQISAKTIEAIENEAMSLMRTAELVQPEYFKIVTADSLQAPASTNGTEKMIALVAAKVGNTRLIDNMFMD